MAIKSQDEKTLDILGIFHYVMGILTAVLASLPLAYFFAGMAMLGAFPAGAEAAPRAAGLLFVFISLLIIAAGWVLAVLIFIAGRRLKQRRSYNFCLMIAFFECLIVPPGTILGTLTIANLNRDPVRRLFT